MIWSIISISITENRFLDKTGYAQGAEGAFGTLLFINNKHRLTWHCVRRCFVCKGFQNNKIIP